ncbi:MAG: FG-GAP-like repeat-containing protein, partial [Candidatus Omnitrophica bacterium]|nr:FG-GAP-like repeat-containing protein [Candidatus Omnitrophota bacterium]
MRNKIVGAVVALCVVFGFATLSFAQEASFKRNLLKKIPPTLSSKSSPSLDSSGVAKSGQLPAYSNGPKPTITFTDINAGLTNIGWSNAAAWWEYESDGYLDIVLMGWSSSPISKIYHNNGNGTFTDINAGLPAVEYGRAAWGDYNNDGYLDILMNPEVKKNFEIRSKIINAMRHFLVAKGYLEIDTPILQPIYGGGLARP